jgi:AraC-like DNA-binding protein
MWAIMILLGAAQGLFLSVYLFARKENRGTNKWLALLLTVISLHLVEYAADITGLTLRYPGFIAITYPLLFCMGPLYWLYCRFLLDGSYKLNYKTLLHFFPALVVLLLMLPFYLMPGEAKIGMISALAQGDTFTVPAGQLVFMAAHVIQTVAYIFPSYSFIRKKRQERKAFSSDASVVKKLDWLHGFSRFFSIYLLLYLVLVVALSFINAYQVQLDYLLLLITAFSMYAIGFFAIGSPEVFKAEPQPESQPALPEKEVTVNGLDVLGRFPGLKEKLLDYMLAEKPFLKSDLKISELADALSVPSYQLSQVINEGFNVNFYDFINTCRVEEAKELLVRDTRGYKVLAIAYEAGFNSKATFNRVFKNSTGLTPSEFRGRFTPESGRVVSTST